MIIDLLATHKERLVEIALELVKDQSIRAADRIRLLIYLISVLEKAPGLDLPNDPDAQFERLLEIVRNAS